MPIGLGSMSRSRNRATSQRLTSRSNARTPPLPAEVLRQAEGGDSAEAPNGSPVNVRLERMGGIFDQRNPESAARCAELGDTVGKTVGVTCQNGGNGRPRCVVDCVDADVSIVGRHRRHHRFEPGCSGRRRTRCRPRAGHEDAIAGREEQLEGEVNGKSTGRHEHALASDTGPQAPPRCHVRCVRSRAQLPSRYGELLADGSLRSFARTRTTTLVPSRVRALPNVLFTIYNPVGHPRATPSRAPRGAERGSSTAGSSAPSDSSCMDRHLPKSARHQSPAHHPSHSGPTTRRPASCRCHAGRGLVPKPGFGLGDHLQPKTPHSGSGTSSDHGHRQNR